ncbi:MBL fold metallo-hydrolase [Actinomadura craniellae]|uniref:MBL fold metallo-hydrolase n=1 Tax=Actinomadura craniellae TaxID=2231787 RepID=A0A365H9W1_9ACTN|nr:MBL fold metallo-hydrolase [Actinomadura craniellae]RAY15802.1 MBL fold metallo-hydrolase [Actinomadura craniellae]
MRVTIIGCSGSFPGPENAASCYLVEAEGFTLMIDLGSGALGALARYHDVHDIDAIYISHLHYDHCIDLCGYWVARRFGPEGMMPKIPVYGPADTEAQLARACNLSPGPGIGMQESFDFQTLTPGSFDIGPFAVTTARMNHPTETFGLRIEQGGAAFAYSADTGESDTLVRLADQADMFLCEASWSERCLTPDLHLTGREAGEHAIRAGADKLVLTHLIPWETDGPQRTLTAAKESGFSGDITLAREGDRYVL